MLWDVKGFAKKVVGNGCSAMLRGAISLWGMLSWLANVVGLFFITVGAFVAIALRSISKIVVRVVRLLLVGVQMLGRWALAGLMASVRWLGGTVAFLGTVFKQMLSWQGIVQGSGRAVQAVRAFPRAFVNRAVLFNPPFYLVYTAVSLVVLLAIGSLVYWQYGNVFTRYALAQHRAVDRMAMGEAESAVDELQDIQNRLEARITATEQRLKELEMKTVTLEKQTEERLEDVSQSVDERVEKFEKKAQKFVDAVSQKTKTLDQQASQQKTAFEQTVAKVEKHVSAIDAKAQKLDAMSHDVHKTVAALSKTTKQQVDTLARNVDEKTGAVVREVAQVHKKIDSTHQATQQKLTHLEKSINEKTATVAAQAKQQLAQATEQLDEQVVAVNKKVDAAALHHKKELEQQANHINTLEKETQQQIKAVNQKTAEVESRVGTLERADVQEARRLSVIGHQVQQEVDAQMKALREQATERKKKADRKKVLERFLDQLADAED